MRKKIAPDLEHNRLKPAGVGCWTGLLFLPGVHANAKAGQELKAFQLLLGCLDLYFGWVTLLGAVFAVTHSSGCRGQSLRVPGLNCYRSSRSKSMRNLCCLCLIVVSVQVFESSVSARTNVATSTLSSAVQLAIDASTSGDTVMVPPGSATWLTPIAISGKALTLLGSGIDSTVITDRTTAGAINADVTGLNFVRISGFTVVASSTHTSAGLVNVDGSQATVGFRFDHNRLLIPSAISRGIIPKSTYGLIDNNVFDVTATSGSVQSVSVWGSSDSSDGGFTPWTRPLTLGSTNAVYIEDNTFNYSTQAEDSIDAYGGARLVIRGNTFNNISVGFHGTDSGNRRSMHSFEIYSNSFVNNSSTHLRAATIRGGTGVVFGNTYGGSGGAWNGVILMYYRACPPLDQSTWGTCNGTLWKLNSSSLSAQGSRVCSTSGTVGFDTVNRESLGPFGGSFQGYFDGPSPNGYPGRDQPGITTGQVSEPIYVWSNDGMDAGTYDGGYPPPGGIQAWIKAGRDYINNGSTPKPGYTPLPYPFPLNGIFGARPSAPKNVRVLE